MDGTGTAKIHSKGTLGYKYANAVLKQHPKMGYVTPQVLIP
jgi:hypothetical protein